MSERGKGTSRMLTYYHTYSEHYGNGPLHLKKRDARAELTELLSKRPSERIVIQKTTMTADEYSQLPEHPGF